MNPSSAMAFVSAMPGRSLSVFSAWLTASFLEPHSAGSKVAMAAALGKLPPRNPRFVDVHGDGTPVMRRNYFSSGS
jgi:hypothetical protein